MHSLAATAMHECREKIGELLSQVCSGVGTEEVAAALQGLLAAAARVRAAAIVALLDVPVFAEGTITDNKVKLPQTSLGHYEYSIQPSDSLLATATDLNVYKITPCHSCCIWQQPPQSAQAALRVIGVHRISRGTSSTWEWLS